MAAGDCRQRHWFSLVDSPHFQQAAHRQGLGGQARPWSRRRGRTTAQVELPVTYTGDLSYHRDKWSAYTEYSDGLGGGISASAWSTGWVPSNYEGGTLFAGRWYPSLGVGFNLTRTFGVDAGFYGTKTFLESEPHLGLAVSMRWDRK